MIVVIDTNIFFGNYFMDRPSFRILLAQHQLGNIALAIPEVVVRETINKFTITLEDALKAVKKNARILRSLRAYPAEVMWPDVSTERR